MTLGLIVLLVIWLVMGLIIGYYATGIFKGERPFGMGGDLAISLVTTLGVGLMGWYFVENFMPNFTGIVRLVAHLLEPPISALIVLWLVRYFKNK
jgi:uncharacterized membrane protein YeaQ/YmgE (transglycosylase-associated protein family)